MQRLHDSTTWESHFNFAFLHAAQDFLVVGRLSPSFLRQYKTWRFRDGSGRLLVGSWYSPENQEIVNW